MHHTAIQVYKLIFQREIDLQGLETPGVDTEDDDAQEELKSTSNIALFFSGLFSSYQDFSFEIKRDFLDHKNGLCKLMLSMKKELMLSLSGFMLCMLPALDEEHEELKLNVKKLLLKTEKIVGSSNFYGEIWKAILRAPRTRAVALRYLKERIPPSNTIEPFLGSNSSSEDSSEEDEESDVDVQKDIGMDGPSSNFEGQ